MIINGAGAHKIHQGDLVIIAAFVLTDEKITPRFLLVDDQNRFVSWLGESV